MNSIPHQILKLKSNAESWVLMLIIIALISCSSLCYDNNLSPFSAYQHWFLTLMLWLPFSTLLMLIKLATHTTYCTLHLRLSSDNWYLASPVHNSYITPAKPVHRILCDALGMPWMECARKPTLFVANAITGEHVHSLRSLTINHQV